ncbi:hypothetical protein GDO78_000263 [Eleutherodactylus coqui]|uniref:Uncharacterized protein n=1 Tax=Eleutherodactylus coqui TaxID=57060 RepID=A0A8J6FPR2_ELECQ|nr:hypothetical protein GDO78_000263 [Eleutherodactylus coqui]
MIYPGYTKPVCTCKQATCKIGKTENHICLRSNHEINCYASFIYKVVLEHCNPFGVFTIKHKKRKIHRCQNLQLDDSEIK